jgi:hypothetical protein
MGISKNVMHTLWAFQFLKCLLLFFPWYLSQRTHEKEKEKSTIVFTLDKVVGHVLY